MVIRHGHLVRPTSAAFLCTYLRVPYNPMLPDAYEYGSTRQQIPTSAAFSRVLPTYECCPLSSTLQPVGICCLLSSALQANAARYLAHTILLTHSLLLPHTTRYHLLFHSHDYWTCSESIRRPTCRSCVSICTFLPVKQVN